MIGALRLPRLSRNPRFLPFFSYLDVFAAGSVFPFTTTPNTSTLTEILGIRHRDRRIRYPVSFQFKRGTEAGFCTRAAEKEEVQLFWPYLSARIRCRKDAADTLSEALLCFGASSVCTEDSDSQDTCDAWITSIFGDDQDVHRCISLAADSVDLKDELEYEVSKVDKLDWSKNIQETFHPIEITSGLWVVPEWRTPVQNAMNIILNPGMSFGTGEHPTTKLCLCLLHSLIKGGEQFLDYGTGSGILGIAALKMGADLSIGIDVDPESVKSAVQNIALNEIDAHKMRVYLVSGLENLNSNKPPIAKAHFDIVTANILLNPLLELAGDIVSYGKLGAVICLSGIISEQVHQIKEHYSMYLDNISVSEMDGWACVHGIKKREVC